MKRAVFACLVALLTAAPAHAALDQESLLQDDPLLLHPGSDAELERTFAILKALGVDRIRVSVFWNRIAPRVESRRKPSFGGRGPSWPDAYPPGTWDRYDKIVLLASKYQIGLLFTLTGPAPAWGAGKGGGELSVHKPKLRDFRAFVTAVGRRYSGTWTPEESAPYQMPSSTPLLPIGPFQARVAPEAEAAQAAGPLPRVAHWSIWNEPNFPSWLLPAWQRPVERETGRLTPAAPALYRRIVDATWRGLEASGHGSDVILIGETAPFGPRVAPTVNEKITPIQFVRELYCLDESYRAFRGARARRRGCPVRRRGRRAFRRRHPGLFENAGFAHHPYSLKQPPTWPGASRNTAPLGGIRRLVRALDRSLFQWGSAAELPIWVTEYGYQTVPDPYRGVSFSRQAKWMSWAEFITYRNPRVAAMAQFLLNDDAPDRRFPEDHPNYWRTWQSGLLTTDGRHKPAFDEYQFPIHVTPRRPRRGRAVRVFGSARPAVPGAGLVARIQVARGGRGFETVKEVSVANARNYVDTRVRTGGAAEVRILWSDPASGGIRATRAARVRPR